MIIKICGIKNKDTLLFCESNNINFYGMIFYPNSPRNINLKEAKELQIESKKLKINGVGVFVNEKIDTLLKYINFLELKFVQLHGEEDFNYIDELNNMDVKIIKKISIKNNSDLIKIDKFKNADYFLFDYKPGKYELPGGNARSFDWNIIRDLRIDKPWFLSGGVNIDNIQMIKSEIKPFGIDLSSGVEKELGIKDNQIINNFIEKYKNA
tara:strand:- start:1195 stop:1824 length:630 start_codon:yes stop_codon:yes gene_type:complete